MIIESLITNMIIVGIWFYLDMLIDPQRLNRKGCLKLLVKTFATACAFTFVAYSASLLAF